MSNSEIIRMADAIAGTTQSPERDAKLIELARAEFKGAMVGWLDKQRQDSGVELKSEEEVHYQQGKEMLAWQAIQHVRQNNLELEVVAMRGDFDGDGYTYVDNGSGSDWRTRHEGWEPVYAFVASAK